MKQIALTLLFAMLFINCRAQTVIPLEDFEDYNQELPDNAHVKDVNNILLPYVGRWSGSYNGNTYIFKIEKFTRISNNKGLRFDKLHMRYKITDGSGNIMANTLDLPDDSKYIISGNYLSESGSYVLNYLGFNAACGQNGSVFISVSPNGNILNLFLSPDGELYPECTTGYAGQVLPKDWIDLYKD